MVDYENSKKWVRGERKRYGLVSFTYTTTECKTFKHAVSFRTKETLIGYNNGVMRIAYHFQNQRTLKGLMQIVKDGLGFEIDLINKDDYDDVISEILDYPVCVWVEEPEYNIELKWNGEVERKLQIKRAKHTYNEKLKNERFIRNAETLAERIQKNKLREKAKLEREYEKKKKKEERRKIKLERDHLRGEKIWEKYKNSQNKF